LPSKAKDSPLKYNEQLREDEIPDLSTAAENAKFIPLALFVSAHLIDNVGSTATLCFTMERPYDVVKDKNAPFLSLTDSSSMITLPTKKSARKLASWTSNMQAVFPNATRSFCSLSFKDEMMAPLRMTRSLPPSQETAAGVNSTSISERTWRVSMYSTAYESTMVKKAVKLETTCQGEAHLIRKIWEDNCTDVTLAEELAIETWIREKDGTS